MRAPGSWSFRHSQDILFLSHLVKREIIYQSENAARGGLRLLQRQATSATGREAITGLKETMRSVCTWRASRGRTNGVSTLHHQFRALTAMSPLQYKELRLRGKERMLMDGWTPQAQLTEVG